MQVDIHSAELGVKRVDPPCQSEIEMSPRVDPPVWVDPPVRQAPLQRVSFQVLQYEEIRHRSS